MDRDLFLTALRVLSRFDERLELTGGDVNAIRRAALPDEADLPIDALCCQIIRRTLEDPSKLFHNPESAEDSAGEITLAEQSTDCTLDENERLHIERVFRKTNQNVAKAARILDIDRSTLYCKLRKYGLKPKRIR